MPDYKYPNGEILAEEDLKNDVSFLFPSKKPVNCGDGVSFEFKITGATALDDSVSFKIYSGLGGDIFDSVNISEIIKSVDLIGQTGSLVFERYISNTIDTFYYIAISGTDPTSTATFLIRARC